MNIVFVSKECPPSPRSCGIGTYVWETGRALTRAGHNVTIIAASDDGQLSSLTPVPRMTVIRLPDDELGVEKRNIISRTLWSPFEKGIAYRERIAQYIASLVDNSRPDILEFPGFRGESVMWLAKQRSLPMVVRIHGATGGSDAVWKDHVSATRGLQINWEHQEVEAADVITAVSEYQASSARAQFGTGRLRVVHNGIDTAQWEALSEDARGELESNDILFVGSLFAKKGIFILLRAANLLRRHGWRGRLVLAGRTSSEFERYIWIRAGIGKKMPDWVVHLGICPRERLARMYREAAICCFPSLIEPFSYTCLEAMACGGIVVGSLNTGMAEMLDETCGFLVSPGDVSGLVLALKSALAMSDEQRRRMRDSAQQQVRDRFDNRVIIPKLLAVYDEAKELSTKRQTC